jgi:NAD(P)-dependent dehydrogenase (short-subunit alcohol dehydrogenase family)
MARLVIRAVREETWPMRRIILITGAAKRLGAALAHGLAKDGHAIAVHFRSSRPEAEETVKAIRDAGGDAATFQNPLADLSDGVRLAEEIAGHFGGLDTLINNAGTFSRQRFDDLTQEDWERDLASTAGAVFIATRAALPHLRASGRGRVINIGDAMGDRLGHADPGMGYYVGKGGVWLMTRTLAAMEARRRVTVNMVSPGVLDDSFCKTPLEKMPLGRYGTYEDVLHPIRFLLEDASEAVTGSNLQVGGGWNIAG